MATKQTKSVTDKKVSVPTKQVPKKAPAPAKTTPVKPVKVKVYGVKETPKGTVPSDRTVKLNQTDSKAFHAAKTPQEQAKVIGKAVLKDKGPAGAAARKIADQAVKQAKIKADKAVAMANLAKAKVKQADANAKLKKVDADIKAAKGIVKVATKAANIVEKKDGAKAAAPLKKTIKKLDEVIKKTGSSTKGYKESTPARYKAAVEKRAPAKKVNKDNASSATSVDKRSIMAEAAPAPVERSIIPPANVLAQQVQQPARQLPREMTREAALKREDLLRNTFGMLQAGAAR